MFRKLLDNGEAGDNIGALLEVRKNRCRGQVLVNPDQYPHTEFECQAYILKKKKVDTLHSLQSTDIILF